MRAALRAPALTLLCLALLGCGRPDLRRSLLAAQPRPLEQGGPMLLAIYQPWFGQKHHLDVGYSSHDPKVLKQQIEKAKAMGISGFVVNYYGPRKEFEDRSYALLQRLAHENGFKVAMQYDEAVDSPQAETDAVIVDLQSAYDHYIAPHAPAHREAYLRYNGRPVIFIFPKHNDKTDWEAVRRAVNTWADPPLLLYPTGNSRLGHVFDGYYAWVQPGPSGWAADGSHWGREYLESFYTRMEKANGKLAVGGVWPGFDDSRASWSKRRFMDPRCGKTFQDTLDLFRRHNDGSLHMPFLLIETWNDHEEGTGIENGLPGCR